MWHYSVVDDHHHAYSFRTRRRAIRFAHRWHAATGRKVRIYRHERGRAELVAAVGAATLEGSGRSPLRQVHVRQGRSRLAPPQQ